jgi:hypothetical protein
VSTGANARSRPEARRQGPPLWVQVAAIFIGCRLTLEFAITGGNVLNYPVVSPFNQQWISEIVALVGVVSLVVLTLRNEGLWRRWIFWQSYSEQGSVKVILWALLALIALTELFTAVTASLLARDFLAVISPIAHSDLYWKTELLYAWHFADAIPAVDATDTLQLDDPPYEFKNAFGGSLVLAYKFLVILPIIGLLVEFISRSRKAAQT